MMHRSDPTANGEVVFSQVREDPRIELRVAERLAESQENLLRIFVVASGGCTALSLLASPVVGKIEAVDVNPAQIHLVELRRQGLLHLSLSEQMALIGADKTTGDRQRLELYEKLHPYLPQLTRAFWDARLEQIAFGVNGAGQFETLLRNLSARCSQVGLDPLEDPGKAIASPAWREIFEAEFTPQTMVKIFGEATDKEGEDASSSEHFAEQLAIALQRYTLRENYYCTPQRFANAYAEGLAGIPLYLQAPAQASIRGLGAHRLRLHCGNFLEKMAELGGSERFDLISLSSLGDGVSRSKLDEAIATAVRYLHPGGAIVARQLYGNDRLAGVMAKHLRVDEELSAELQAIDRSFLPSEVAIAFAG